MENAQVNRTLFQFASRSIKNDDEVLLKALEYNRQHLIFANHRQLLNREIVLQACKTKESYAVRFNQYSVLTMCLSVLKDIYPYSEEFILEILELDPLSACCAVKHFKNSRSIITKAIEIAPYLIGKISRQTHWFSDQYLTSIALRALDIDVCLYRQMGYELKSNRELMLKACSKGIVQQPANFILC